VVRPGGSLLTEKLEELQNYLYNYLGSINELKLGGGLTGVKIPDKPEALLREEQCQALGLPLVAGGVMDQPYIWMQELAVIRDAVALFEALEKRNQQTQ